jgi:hypothetical protein
MNDFDPFGLFGPGFGFQALRDRAEVISFYGVEAYNQIAAQEKRQREDEKLLRRVRPDLIDDVAAQISQST